MNNCIYLNLCNVQKQKLNNDKTLTELKEKIMKTKSVNAKVKLIDKYEKTKTKIKLLSCLIKKCRYNLIMDFQKKLKNYKNKIININKRRLPKIIKEAIDICEKIFIKPKFTMKDFKLLARNLDLIKYYSL